MSDNLPIADGPANNRSIVASHEKTTRQSTPRQPEQGNNNGLKSEEGGIDSSENEANIVWWDGDKDPENPYNWAAWRKYTNCALISALTFVTPLASSMFAPGVPELMQHFHSSNTELSAFVVSVYVLGFAFGPMVMAPLSEIYGRMPVYHACNICFVVFLVACAVAPSLESLIAFRFFSGTFGAAPLTNGGGSIADMFPSERRAIAMAGFSVGPLIGPIIGPIIGGIVAEQKGWRWVFWVLAMISGVLAIAMLLLMRETFAPVILQRKAQRLQKETGNPQLHSKLETGLSTSELFKRSLVRPLKLLLFSPICTIFALYMVLVYGYLYLLFTSITFVFQEYYGFSTTLVGLVYLGLGVGSFIGMIWYTWDSNREIKKAMTDIGYIKPEIRLRLLPIAAIIFPVGLFIYGWTVEYHEHWIAPIIGLGVVGVGNIICLMGISVYLVDAYTTYAASALAANTIMRSVAGAVLPLCGLKMYDTLGMGWGSSLLAFVATAFIPIPFIILRYGEKVRLKFEIRNL